MHHDANLLSSTALIEAEAPKREIYDFVGTLVKRRHEGATSFGEHLVG